MSSEYQVSRLRVVVQTVYRSLTTCYSILYPKIKRNLNPKEQNHMNASEKQDWQTPQIIKLEITESTRQLPPPDEPVQS
ncbi:MAG: hypothetical protein JJU37_15895 [Balneolaceae bacterium]|nr:hypothetical protein [Balneolaceae bacterium]